MQDESQLNAATESAIVAALSDFTPYTKEEKTMENVKAPSPISFRSEAAKLAPIGKRFDSVVAKAQAVFNEMQGLCQHVTGVQALDDDSQKDDGSRGVAGHVDWQATVIEKKLDGILQAISTVRRQL
ncbi:hypothetical protein V3589_14980 [Sinorhizobium fredii]|uniref:hypothetical protein n=1 Tax=Rhizobium fredii TaxID=380 RepID=UPI00309D46BB